MLSTDFVFGAPNWIDLGVPDSAAAAAFYGALLGWQLQDAGPDSGGYGFFTHEGAMVGAVGPLAEEGARPAWTIYFQTSDADATAEAVGKAGGAVRVAPFDVFEEGRTAAFTDPTGAQFGVWQPGNTRGLDAVTRPGSLAWTELHTSDAAAAKDFYGDVFGWQVRDEPMDGFTYTVARPRGGGDGSDQAGIMQMSQEMAAGGAVSMWQPYFEVADCDAVCAKAAELGASVYMGAETVEGVGRLAAFADPFGAAFAIITSV